MMNEDGRTRQRTKNAEHVGLHVHPAVIARSCSHCACIKNLLQCIRRLCATYTVQHESTYVSAVRHAGIAYTRHVRVCITVSMYITIPKTTPNFRRFDVLTYSVGVRVFP